MSKDVGTEVGDGGAPLTVVGGTHGQIAQGNTIEEEEEEDDDEDFGTESFPPTEITSLISFENLENVIKHVIRKFKAVEAHNQETMGMFEAVRKDVSARVQTTVLDEVTAELRQKCDFMSKTIAHQKDSISSLENHLERSRVLCGAIERKLEACIQEKAVQDRKIRETQDALSDKVAVAELNMFEAKFAGYTTKLEYQGLVSMLSQYTRSEETERLADNMRVLATQFDDYTRTARIDQQLQELNDWVSDELLGYAKAGQTAQKFEKITSMVREQTQAFERVHSMMDDKIRALSDRITSIYTEFRRDIEDRALDSDFQDMIQQLQKYALRQETDIFQQDCFPKLKFCVESIKIFDERLQAQDQAIQRVDDVLLDKAGKYDVVLINARIDCTFPKDKAEAEFQRMFERLEWMNAKLEQYIAKEVERLSQFRPPNYEPTFEQIRQSLMLKADRADLVELYSLKANRIDADELAKLQETVHRQLEYLAVTNFGLAKLALTDARNSESKTIRTQQKAQVLMQSEMLWHWILHNETPPNLDTLRAPKIPANDKSGGNSSGVGGSPRVVVSDGGAVEAVDAQKRKLDNDRRSHWERKIASTTGSDGGGAGLGR